MGKRPRILSLRMGKISITSTYCPKSVVTVVLGYMKALKLWRFENLLVNFWPYFTAHAQNGNFLGFGKFGCNSDNGMRVPVRVDNFDDQTAIVPVFGYFSLRMRRNAVISTSEICCQHRKF